MQRDPSLNEDFIDLLRAMLDAGVEFVVVGAHALAVHGVPRATGDMDVLVSPESKNAGRVLDALRTFGAPIDQHGLKERDLCEPGTVYQIGLPPRRIDLLTQITGVSFADAWDGRVMVSVAGLDVPFLGRESLMQNKRTTGRAKDLADIETLAGDDGESSGA